MKEEKKAQEKKSPGIAGLVIATILVAALLKTYIIDIQRVSGTSMEPAIPDGSLIVLSKIHYGFYNPSGDTLRKQWKTPERGDVVYYWYNDRPVIKRCVATEHETLAFSTDSGYSMSVGGNTIPLTEGQYQRLKFNSEVPEGTILAIGDNYASSIDSRDYGFISVASIMGKVLWQ
ncbi:MAG: signal peptidase I [Treponema sp.]|nr:signal peptidase I [Candidatus Treponema caballi]